VRLSDSTCPFCQTAASRGAAASRGGRAIRDLVGARASRAALFAGALIVAGCGNGDDDDDGGGPQTGDAGGGDSSVIGQPAYGAPVGTDGGVARDDAGTPIAQPVYGSPVHEDGG
jgi:hypothetical protein